MVSIQGVLCFASYGTPKNESIDATQGNNRCLFSDPYKTCKYAVWAERRNVNVKPDGVGPSSRAG